jgi:hypothetical protein
MIDIKEGLALFAVCLVVLLSPKISDFLTYNIRRLCQRKLTETGPPSTFLRLWTSRHLGELQWIAVLTIILFSIGVVSTTLIEKKVSTETWVLDNLKVIGGLAAVAAAVFSWAYQTGSRRLGVIDLFGCEISAICRMNLVVDFAKRQVKIAHEEKSRSGNGAASGPTKFTSEEHYTPVYDHNLADLQPLNVSAVSHVTEFYSYRKAMVDFLRRIAAEQDLERKHEARKMMLYMQFLMCESARRAVMELIEFEPNLEESKINILCSELVLFSYLLEVYNENDFRGKRLRIRKERYPEIVKDTLDATAKGQGINWQRAMTTAEELKTRAKDCIGYEYTET